jgi:Tfp pilus assembly PilM family ATPase
MRTQRPSSWWTPRPPTVAIEIASRRVTVVKIAGGTAQPVVAAYASEPLAPGVVVPGLSGTNIAQPKTVVETLQRAIERAGLGAVKRAALILPDSVARVSLLTFEQIPQRAADFSEVVRWQLRKATPFPLEEAQLSYFPTSVAGPSGTTVATIVARRDVIAEYEALALSAGIHAGLVDLASFNVMNAIVGGGQAPPGDWLLVHLGAEGTTVAILRGSDLLFYRHRTAVDEEPLRAIVHQTAMYHEDRLGGGPFGRVWIAGGASADAARREIGDRLGVAAEAVDLPTVSLAGDRGRVSPEVLDALAAPLGILMRERKAA